MKRLLFAITLLLMFGLYAQARHLPKATPLQADALCCGCTAIINGTCVGYHCGLCPLFVPKAENGPISLLPKELHDFLPELTGDSKCARETQKMSGGGRTKK